ncbi:ferredoxin reductase, partial [Streptococcus sp. GMD1S]
MKRGKKMFIIILSTLGLLALITWSAIAYLGRS